MKSLRTLAFAWLLATATCTSAKTLESSPTSDGRHSMGTVLEITLHGVAPRVAAEALDDLFAEAARLDELLSVYLPSSDISRLNRTAGSGPQPVAPAVAEILARSIEYSDLTEGAFDVTVGSLIELWMRADERNALPTEEELTVARERTGPGKIRIEPGGAVSLQRSEVSIDLGGIAKGYALDRMRSLLKEFGATSALLSFGQSSSWAVGAPPGARGWRLLVRGPESEPLGLITLRDQALSVSGSMGRGIEIQGQRFGHIIDPRSGKALIGRRQALVVSTRATLAEALSKALLVLDPARGLDLVTSQPDCEGMIVEADGELIATPGWFDAVRFEHLTQDEEQL